MSEDKSMPQPDGDLHPYPPPKRKSLADGSGSSSSDEEKKEQVKSKKKRMNSIGQLVDGSWQVPRQVSSATDNNNNSSTTSILNPTLDPSTSNWGLLQNRQAGNLMLFAVNPMWLQGQDIAQGQVEGASVSTGNDTNMTTAQHLAYMHQLQQLQSQLSLPTSMAATTVTESSLTSSAEKGGKLSLQKEVEQLRIRVNNLEADNMILKQRIEVLEMENN
jgi:hypothetical protein